MIDDLILTLQILTVGIVTILIIVATITLIGETNGETRIPLLQVQQEL